MLRYIVGLAGLVAATVFVPAAPAHAAMCADGVYRAGCVGPNGAAVVRKPPAYYGHNSYYHRNYYNHSSVHCAHGYYHGGCVRSY